MKYKPDFLIIPYLLFEDDKLQTLDKVLYSVVYYFEKMRDEKCRASNKTLAEYCKTKSPTSIQNSLNRLEECGYIKRIYADPKTRRKRKEIKCLIRYNVSFNDDTQNNKVSSDKKVSSVDDTVSSTDDTRVSSTDDHINKTNINKNLISTSTQKNNGIKGSDINALLDIFYQEFKDQKVFKHRGHRQSAEFLIDKHGIDKAIQYANAALKVRNMQFAPVITTPTELRDKFPKLVTFFQRERSRSGQIVMGSDFSKK